MSMPLHHDTLAQREEDAAQQHPAPFDTIYNWIQLGVVLAFASAVTAFVLGTVVGALQASC